MPNLYTVNDNGQMEINFEVLEVVIENKQTVSLVKTFSENPSMKCISVHVSQDRYYSEFAFASKSSVTIIQSTKTDCNYVVLSKDELKILLKRMELEDHE